MTMIEKVARAIDPGAFDPKLTHGDDCIECENQRERVKACARAAIEAMKEPSEEMKRSGSFINNAQSGVYCEKDIWVAMIEAALKE